MQMQVVITEEEFQKLHWVIAAKVADALNVIQVDCVLINQPEHLNKKNKIVLSH